jgi:threonine/homoserine/homoserine lactone efflux protein
VLSYLIFGITYAFAAAVQPGPLQTYIISQTLKKGWRPTLPAAFAPVISDIPILTLVLFLLSTMPDSFIVILRIGGGLFLLYLGFRAFKSWKEFDEDQTISNESGQQTLFNAVFVNILNPAPYLGWSLIMGPLFLEGWRLAPINGIAMIIGFYLTMILTLAGIIILFGFARKFGPKVSKLLIGLSSIVLFVFGIYQLWLGINNFVQG